MAQRRRWPLSPLRPALAADSGEHIARRDRSISDDVNTRCSSPHDCGSRHRLHLKRRKAPKTSACAMTALLAVLEPDGENGLVV